MVHGIKSASELPDHFADWVGYRLRLKSNFEGFWRDAILSRIPDEALALDRFYELRDEYMERKATVVAHIRGDAREYTVSQRVYEGGEFVECTKLLPISLRIIVYTDDPGFFLQSGQEEPCEFDGWFFPALDDILIPPRSSRFEAVNVGVWDRLLAENKQYGRNRNRVRSRNQKK